MNETLLLQNALLFEQGHSRRTRHILSVYGFAKIIGENAHLNDRDLNILLAAAILHDIAIKYCKEKYHGDASQENQRKEAPYLAKKFLREANYPSDYDEEIIYLIKSHHLYNDIRTKLQQLLIEADLIVNCIEADEPIKKAKAVAYLFKTATGKQLLNSIH